MVIIEKILEELRALGQRMDQIERATGDLGQVEGLRHDIGDIHAMLRSLPNRMADAISAALVIQQRTIIGGVREELLEAEARRVPEGS